MKNSIKQTQNYYDGISNGYGQLYHQEQIQKINLVKEYFPKEGILLDLGSGDGVLNQFLSKKINLISMDLSFQLLKLNSNNNKILALAEIIPIKKEKIDLIFAFTVFQDLIEPKLALLEVKRILKKNGLFVISFLKISTKLKLIEKELEKNFKLVKKIEEKKDFIFICKKKI